MSNESVDTGVKYKKAIRDTEGKAIGAVDIYSVTEAFNCDSILSHAVKKILCYGERGVKDPVNDLEEALVSIQRKIKILNRTSPCDTK